MDSGFSFFGGMVMLVMFLLVVIALKNAARAHTAANNAERTIDALCKLTRELRQDVTALQAAARTVNAAEPAQRSATAPAQAPDPGQAVPSRTLDPGRAEHAVVVPPVAPAAVMASDAFKAGDAARAALVPSGASAPVPDTSVSAPVVAQAGAASTGAVTAPADKVRAVAAAFAVAAAQTSAPSASASASTSPSASAPTLNRASLRSSQAVAARAESEPAWMAKLWSTARQWLFGGNLVAKLGLMILFIGVSFLLKYTAARVSVPIEFRLAGVVLADIALLAWAWRIRLSRPAISLPVQGTALAILMLVTFGAFRLYHLLPGSMAFALLFVLTVFTCVLALLQDARWLAVFGITGGFAAPILASTGGGSHIALFSYYALLNAGVLALALVRSWRMLNVLGFAFTFVIGTTWGVLNYMPEHYLSVQLFLILFFVYYVAIALSYAVRQAPGHNQYVDASLVFGTPLLAFGLQYGLVREMAFGLALSAMALGLFYGALALATWRRGGAGLRMLIDSFMALAIVFGTLALPLALDGRWTSAAWALEGAAMVWIGLRQQRTAAWVFGLLVQLGAWVSFGASVSGLDTSAALGSNLWLGFLLLGASAFFMATNFRAQRDDGATHRFGWLAGAFLVGASIWLVLGAWVEIVLRTHGVDRSNLLVASALVAAIGLAFIARRMDWALASRLALAAQLLAGGTLLLLSVMSWEWRSASPDLFDRPILGALMICAGAGFTSWNLMRQNDKRLHLLAAASLAWSQLWWFGTILPLLAGWTSTHYQIFTSGTWGANADLWRAAYALLLVVSAPLSLWLVRRLTWPALRWATVTVWAGLALCTLDMLFTLYPQNQLPHSETVLAWLALWLTGEWLLRKWAQQHWALSDLILKLLHTVRTAGPWLMIWPVCATWIARYLQDGNNAEAQLLADAGWHASASWARFVPMWLMMLALFWLMARCRRAVWPVTPLAHWYRHSLIPLGCVWAILLVAVWNVTQNGAMAPLPYVPLINPLDLSSCFAMLLAVACYRMMHGDIRPAWSARLPQAGACIAYALFNLALLRAVANYRDIPYDFDALFASQFVQAMLSLVWSGTALLLMRHGAKRTQRGPWLYGAALLALVVGKLFLVDLSNVGGVERIISFLGVGALMVGIGYIAPYPTTRDKASATTTTVPETDFTES